MKEINEIHKDLVEIAGDIKRSNNFVLDASKKLKLVMYNLQIEAAHISQPNGISAISEELQRILDSINENVTNLIDRDRTKFQEALSALDEAGKLLEYTNIGKE